MHEGPKRRGSAERRGRRRSTAVNSIPNPENEQNSTSLCDYQRFPSGAIARPSGGTENFFSCSPKKRNSTCPAPLSTSEHLTGGGLHSTFLLHPCPRQHLSVSLRQHVGGAFWWREGSAGQCGLPPLHVCAVDVRQRLAMPFAPSVFANTSEETLWCRCGSSAGGVTTRV